MNKKTSSAISNIWSFLKAIRPDLFTWLILAALALGSVAPIRGESAALFGQANNIAISFLFFLHGARLSRRAITAGISHWRLHLLVLALTFVLFPLLGLAISGLAFGALPPLLVTGLLYLCVLPSTVQSSIAYTSMAGGNIPAAICSASLSNIAGVVVTPLLVSAFLGTQAAAATLEGVKSIVMQILAPFVVGHLARPLLGGFLNRRRQLLVWFDRVVIIAIVYRAFSGAVVNGVWTQLSATELLAVCVASALMLGVVTFAASVAARALGFPKADEVSIIFCGSQKSLASGAPMAGILFPAATVGAVILPLMIYHQMQLMLGAFMARRLSQQAGAARAATPGPDAS